MAVAIVTGSSGLIGSESVRFLLNKGLDVVGIDNNFRKVFFGESASTESTTKALQKLDRFRHTPIDIRDKESIFGLFQEYGKSIYCVIHAAAQPSHDWAARDPFLDFTINANGTLTLLEALRQHAPDAVFTLLSTNKVYGDRPNQLPLIELPTRWELDPSHELARWGIDENFPIDQSKHSLFGASKVAADVLTQEYGRYFGFKTGVFRGGCLTGPAHAGAELHGFLSYLVKCVQSGTPYKVYGYKGKQVRDNIHSYDLVNALWHFIENPRPGEVYNMGGSRHSNCSMLEAIEKLERKCGKSLPYSVVDSARSGDHIWWISDVRKFQSHFPEWQYRYDLDTMLDEMVEANLPAASLSPKLEGRDDSLRHHPRPQ